jgi:LacI family transcriptional regulator
MVTIKDVAKKSGFSVATVSAVINGVPVVSPKATEKILAAINELGYRPNHIARSLKSSKTSSLAIIVRDITNPFYPEVIMGFEDVAWSNNYEVFLCNTENNLERERKYIDNLIGKRVDGVVIATSLIQRGKHYERLIENGIPYVYLNRRPDELLEHEYFVGSNNPLASEKAVAHLAKLGYQDIHFMSGPLHLSTFKERFQGFLNGMGKMGLTVEDHRIMICSDFSEKVGYENAKKMLRTAKLPEAIFCASDLLAFGVHQALKEEGVKIPEDVALIGLDNNRYGHLIDLSSVEPNNKLMGRTACEILLGLLQKGEMPSNQREFLTEPHVVIRKSCGAEIRKKIN